MKRRVSVRRSSAVLFTVLVVAVSAGVDCPTNGDGSAPLNPPPAPGNRAPRIIITQIATPQGDNFAEQGELVTIFFSGQDTEDTAMARIFVSTSNNPLPQQEISLLNDFPIGPGSGGGSVAWETGAVDPNTYFVFAEIDDQTLDPFTGTGNPPTRTTFFEPVDVAPPGTQGLNSPPELVLVDPLPNLGLSVQDEVTIRYLYADEDSDVTVTLLLDKDLDPTNDDINNPGDPLDPNTNIIILPSEQRMATDPTFDGDPAPPDDPNNPPVQPDSVEIRTNPRTFGPTPPLGTELKEYRFVIDFTQIPVRSEPYFVRGTITDGEDTVHNYAVGSLTISALANGVVDVEDLGFSLAGARLQGFTEGENLGTDFVASTDLDLDGQEDFMIASRFGSPRLRFQSGAAYLIYGRRKSPFPPDTNDNGLPDTPDAAGGVIDFPEPPPFLPNPYDAINVGRFGGVVSINSLNTFFRGTIYGMPEAHNDSLPPPPVLDDNHLDAHTAGLMSITRIDMTADGIADLVFGLPFVASGWDHHDDDPADGCEIPYDDLFDMQPNSFRCGTPQVGDDLNSERNFAVVDQGMVIMVDGTNDIRDTFNRFVDANLAGQFEGAGGAIDDEGVLHGAGTTPRGMRFRGGWFDAEDFEFPFYSDSEFGRTVSTMPSFDNDDGDELIISSPGYDPLGGLLPDGSPNAFDATDIDRGRIQIWLTNNYISGAFYDDDVLSLPSYGRCPTGTCVPNSMPSQCQRCFIGLPNHNEIFGQEVGDRFGFATNAGDVNQDGTPDVLAGAPGADRNGLIDNGIVYIIQTPQGGFGDIDLSTRSIPRLEIIGTNNNDRFGEVQTSVQDINEDGISDVAFSAPLYDENVPDDDVGFVGVIFGDRPITGEEGFSPEEVGTPDLPGVQFLGVGPGAHAGHDVASAGDFNGDGIGDLLITSPGEVRNVDGENRLGVAYLIFGGRHLINRSFNLGQVGNPELPGIVFISRFEQGTVDEAPLETVGGLGDIDGDGFDDIAIGAPTADFVNLVSPDQRRRDAGEVIIVYGSNFGSNDLTP